MKEFYHETHMVVIEVRLQNCEKWLSALPCLPIHPSVRTERLGSHWTDFYEILYFSIFQKSCQNF